MKRLLLVSASIIVLSSCDSDFKKLEVPSSGQIYQANQASANNIAASGYAEALADGTVKVVLGVDNQSDDSLNIVQSAQIETDDAVRSEVSTFLLAKTSILPNSFDTLVLIFNPINNLAVFQATGYKGDLLEEYLLDLSFIEGLEGKSIQLEAGDWWKAYKGDSQEASMVPFIMEADTLEGQDWQVRENEVMAKGVLFKAKAYKIQDSLTINIELVNHGEVEAGIFTSKLTAALNPMAQENISRIFWLAKGGRWENRFTVYFPADSASLPADLMIDKFSEPLWPSNIRLRKMGN